MAENADGSTLTHTKSRISNNRDNDEYHIQRDMELQDKDTTVKENPELKSVICNKVHEFKAVLECTENVEIKDIKHEENKDENIIINDDKKSPDNRKIFNINARFDLDIINSDANNKMSDSDQRFSPKWRQSTAAMGPILMIFAAGLSSGYSATLLPNLRAENSTILVNKNSPSWIASMAAMPMSPGCLVGGWLIERFGRRHTLRTLSLPFFVGWILILSAQNLGLMLTGRFLNGLSIGLLATSMSVFISESTSPELRGMFLAFLSFSLALGIFVAHILGTWLTWRWTAIICSIFPLLSALILCFVPESPVWLLSKGKTEDGIKSFHWFRGYDNIAASELNALVEKFKSNDTITMSYTDKLKDVVSPEFYKPLLIMIVIYLTCQFCGIYAITFYSVDIIENAVGEGIDRYLATLTIDSIRVITTLVTCLTSRKYPRRTLCTFSGILTTISLIALSMFLYYFNDKIPTNLSVVPLSFISVYIIAINIGLMPLPWIIVGELFPAKTRSLGAGVASAVGYISLFIVVKTAPTMLLNLGQVYTFMFYGMTALIGTGILFIILPETKGRSLLEIESLFKKKKIFKTAL